MMRLFEKTKDGGPKSVVDAYFLCEFKSLFSIALLKFNKGCRETYHSHAFNALTWFFSGSMEEEKLTGEVRRYKFSLWPKVTLRDNIHRVRAYQDSYALTIRGPWFETWFEEQSGIRTTLTHGRVIIDPHTGKRECE